MRSGERWRRDSGENLDRLLASGKAAPFRHLTLASARLT
jgi:hypothetical protein